MYTKGLLRGLDTMLSGLVRWRATQGLSITFSSAATKAALVCYFNVVQSAFRRFDLSDICLSGHLH